MQKLNLIGQKFGKLEVIKEIGIYHGSTLWLCRCECGNTTEASTNRLKTKKNKTHCGCIKHIAYNNKYIGDISGIYWQHLISGAKSRKIKVLISKDDAWNQYIKQNGKCALSGLPIYHKKYVGKDNGKDLYTEQTASLDRIDSSKDYTVDNIQWIHKTINFMKRDICQNDFINLCLKIVEYNNAITKM